MKKGKKTEPVVWQRREYQPPFAEITPEGDEDIITTSSQEETVAPTRPPDMGEWDLFAYDEFAW